MPAKMISDVPLPTPRCVICSPSHIRNIVPPTSVMTVVARKNMPGSMTTAPAALRDAFKPDGDAVGLQCRQNDGQIAGVLVDLLAAGFAFLLQRFELRIDRAHQLHDDGGRDVRHDVQRENRQALERAATEHVEHAENAAGLGFERRRKCRRIDARQRNKRAEAENDQRAEGEPQPLLQILGLGEGAEIQVRSKLLCSGNHRSSLLTVAAGQQKRADRDIVPVFAEKSATCRLQRGDIAAFETHAPRRGL